MDPLPSANIPQERLQAIRDYVARQAIDRLHPAAAQVLADIRIIINDIPDIKAREGALQDTIDTLRAHQQTLQGDLEAMTLLRERVTQLESEKAEDVEGRAEVKEELREEKIKTAELEQAKADLLEEMRTMRLELESRKRKADQSELELSEMEVLIDAAQARDEVSLEERRKMVEMGKKRRRVG